MRSHRDHILCPYCDKEADEEQRSSFVSYWGSEHGGWDECWCQHCDAKFDVQESVTREWAVKRKEED